MPKRKIFDPEIKIMMQEIIELRKKIKDLKQKIKNHDAENKPNTFFSNAEGGNLTLNFD